MRAAFNSSPGAHLQWAQTAGGGGMAPEALLAVLKGRMLRGSDAFVLVDFPAGLLL